MFYKAIKTCVFGHGSHVNLVIKLPVTGKTFKGDNQCLYETTARIAQDVYGATRNHLKS